MRLYKVVTKDWTVREVDGDAWPATDSDGDKCFENTHFTSHGTAWAKLETEALAWVQIAARDVTRQRAQVLMYEKYAADAAIALNKVMTARAEFAAQDADARNEDGAARFA